MSGEILIHFKVQKSLLADIAEIGVVERRTRNKQVIWMLEKAVKDYQQSDKYMNVIKLSKEGAI